MNRFTKYPHLFEPIKIGNLTLKNRIEMPPMGPKLGDPDYRVTEEQMYYFDERAKCGAGVITIPDFCVDLENGATHAMNFYNAGEKSLLELQKLVRVIHKHGAAASIEFTHAGAGANNIGENYAYCVSERAADGMEIFAEFGNAKKQKVITNDEIKLVIQKYCDAAKLCKEAGFDMIFIMAGHGALPQQFLSPMRNHRTDEYGGSREKRRRFLVELLTALRETVGPGYPIEMRISAVEYEEDGIKLDEMIEHMQAVQHLINIVHVSSGSGVGPTTLRTLGPYYFPRKPHEEFAAAMKAALNIPVNVVSSIVTLENAEKLIAEGKCDMVAMGRSALADPEIFVKGARGLTDEDIRPCVRCSNCQARAGDLKSVCCTVNPKLGYEMFYNRYPEKAPVSKKVVIVGGGPAGMEAARTAAGRGHRVVLFEKAETLGGMLPTICTQSFKYEYQRYYEWAVRETMACGAEIRLRTEATPERIAEENPDAVIIAIGGVSNILPTLPLSDKVVTVDDVDNGMVPVGKRVVIAGGGVSGVECAMELADAGKQVTVVDIKPLMAWAGTTGMHMALRLMSLQQKGVLSMPEVAVVRESENGVILCDEDGDEFEVEADTVVVALGKHPDVALIDELSSVVPETYVIGTAHRDCEVMDATHEAFFTAMDL